MRVELIFKIKGHQTTALKLDPTCKINLFILPNVDVNYLQLNS